MEKNNKKWMYWFSLGFAIIVIYNIFDNIESIASFLGGVGETLAPFFVGILIAYILYIPAKKIEQFFEKSKMKFVKKKSRGLAIISVYLIISILIAIALNCIFPIISESVIDLASNFETYFNETIEKYNQLPEDDFLKGEEIKNIIDKIQNIDIYKYINIDNIVKYAENAIGVVTGVVDFFLAVIVSIFVLAQRTRIITYIKRLLNAMFKERTYNNINKIFNNTNEVFFRFLAGQFLDAIIVGILTTIVMSIMGIKYAPLFGFLIGLFNMIPYVGAIIAVAISGIVTIITGGLEQAIWLVVVVTIVQQLDANIINPKIIGDSLKISPLAVLFAVTVGGAYFGILGMFLSVPVVAVILIVIDDYVKYKLWKKKQEKINVNFNEDEDIDKYI